MNKNHWCIALLLLILGLLLPQPVEPEPPPEGDEEVNFEQFAVITGKTYIHPFDVPVFSFVKSGSYWTTIEGPTIFPNYPVIFTLKYSSDMNTWNTVSGFAAHNCTYPPILKLINGTIYFVYAYRDTTTYVNYIYTYYSTDDGQTFLLDSTAIIPNNSFPIDIFYIGSNRYYLCMQLVSQNELQILDSTFTKIASYSNSTSLRLTPSPGYVDSKESAYYFAVDDNVDIDTKLYKFQLSKLTISYESQISPYRSGLTNFVLTGMMFLQGNTPLFISTSLIAARIGNEWKTLASNTFPYPFWISYIFKGPSGTSSNYELNFVAWYNEFGSQPYAIIYKILPNGGLGKIQSIPVSAYFYLSNWGDIVNFGGTFYQSDIVSTYNGVAVEPYGLETDEETYEPPVGSFLLPAESSPFEEGQFLVIWDNAETKILIQAFVTKVRDEAGGYRIHLESGLRQDMRWQVSINFTNYVDSDMVTKLLQIYSLYGYVGTGITATATVRTELPFNKTLKKALFQLDQVNKKIIHWENNGEWIWDDGNKQYSPKITIGFENKIVGDIQREDETRAVTRVEIYCKTKDGAQIVGVAQADNAAAVGINVYKDYMFNIQTKAEADQAALEILNSKTTQFIFIAPLLSGVGKLDVGYNVEVTWVGPGIKADQQITVASNYLIQSVKYNDDDDSGDGYCAIVAANAMFYPEFEEEQNLPLNNQEFLVQLTEGGFQEFGGIVVKNNNDFKRLAGDKWGTTGPPEGWTITDGTNCFTEVISLFGGHKDIVRMYDNQNGAICDARKTGLIYNVISLWVGIDDNTKTGYIYLWEGASRIGTLVVRGTDQTISWYDGSSYFIIEYAVVNDSLYHILLRFETSSVEAFNKGVKMGTYTLENPVTAALDQIIIQTNSTDASYNFYLDSIVYDIDDVKPRRNFAAGQEDNEGQTIQGEPVLELFRKRKVEDDDTPDFTSTTSGIRDLHNTAKLEDIVPSNTIAVQLFCRVEFNSANYQYAQFARDATVNGCNQSGFEIASNSNTTTFVQQGRVELDSLQRFYVFLSGGAAICDIFVQGYWVKTER